MVYSYLNGMQEPTSIIVPLLLRSFFINKYVLSIVHHGRPAGERGFYTPKTRFVNLSIYPKSKFTKHEE